MILVVLAEGLLCLVALLVLVPASVLFAQVVMALPRSRPRAVQPGRRPSIAVLIPACNEERGIASTLRDIAPQLVDGDRLLVLADNCTDDTAKVAAGAGAEVLQRSDSRRRGKGYALDFGVRHLEANPPEAVLVIDADCRVGSGAVERLARSCVGSGRPVQGLDLMLSPPGAGIKTRIMEFAWLVKNQVRMLGFDAVGLPCQLKGTGMAFPWTVIRSARLASGSIVEDLELGIELARGGTPPMFCREARVTSYFPQTTEGVSAQRTRWEHGHLDTILRAAPPLFLEALRRRDARLFALACDLTVPPLALLTLAALSVFAASAVLALATKLMLPLWAASLSLVLLVLAVLLAWARYGRRVISLGDLALAPLYALWKLPLYSKFLVRRQGAWVRSARDVG